MSWIQSWIVALCVQLTSGHLCLISPRQRGDLDLSTSGNPTCFRHALPCGGQPVQDPVEVYAPGQNVFFRWQQNYNHYEPGFPGYMDLSIASSPESMSFVTLTVVTDPYVHAQDYQQNYTAVIKLPDMECDHCVIRARYDAHKPGESPFLQCADIKISKGAKKSEALKYLSAESKTDQQKLVPLKRALKLKKYYEQKYKSNLKMDDTKMYGFAYNPFQPHRSDYISVSVVTGATQMLNSFAFGIDDPSDDQKSTFMLDEVVAIDNGRNTTTILVHDSGSRESAAKTVYIIGPPW
ncbi:uncharacterized protein LOC127878788 [Dreissena polymorpha]|nr:uncharacterized protein LOC127878788 [Dreissena polymorpha]